ncbi:TraB/GumN family protein [Marinomonas ostreistagni]|uniref:TraB/GumN family protein n=1 Tax=Marinomonas ostreistagni TaxID=359209 RepID=A0ABS0ZBK2_9GAMM|nr:TraB/GumN family protein [Marinomonas ostreistagni]MBJ7550788.1 TraB/GumN family protein [Marinomonas ostreistagni]
MRPFLLIFKLSLTVFVAVTVGSAKADTVAYQPFMWKVQHQGATVFLVGSIHALTPDFYPLPAAYEEAFKSADRLAVELDPEQLDPNQSARLVQSKMCLPKDVTIDRYLDDTRLSALKDFAKANQSDYERLLHIRPWMLVEQLTQAQLRNSEYQAEYGIDLHFLQLAKQRKLPILEIETLSQQISAIADTPFQAQLAMLKTSLDQMEDEDYMAQMTAYWRKADPDGLYQFVYQDVLENPKLKPMMEALLDHRNQRMADVISIYLGQSPNHSQTTFVVIGALHLSGPQSVIKELEKKGFHPIQLFK